MAILKNGINPDEVHALLDGVGFEVKHETYLPPREGSYSDCPQLHPVLMDYIHTNHPCPLGTTTNENGQGVA